MPSIPRGCDVYCQPDRILIATRITDKTLRKGPSSPFYSYDINTSTRELGEAIKNAIESIRFGLTEQEFDSEIKQFFEFAEVKDWNRLERNWNYIAVSEEPSGNIVIIPTKKMPAGGYFYEIGDPEWSSKPLPEELGKSLRKAIQYLYQP